MTRPFAAALAFMLLAGCEPQAMDDMPRYEALEPSRHFDNDASARPPVPGTVARDADLSPVSQAIPLPVDTSLLERGRERFDIFCVPCHGAAGDGNGIIVQRGFPAPPSFHQTALRRASDRHFFNVITNGYGAMYSYAARVPPRDRWAIAAYIRALQFSRHAPVADLREDLRSRLAEEDAP